MAEIVGAFAGSHAPLIARDWDLFPEGLRARFTAAYRESGRRLQALAPDLIIAIAIAPDHWTNFFLNNLPAICIGVGPENDGPPEPFMRAFPLPVLPSNADFALGLVTRAMEEGFEPALSHRLMLDHGFAIPLWRMELEPMPPIVPIIINDLEPPMISLARCAQWGEMIARMVADYPEPLRVAILATGGMSHSIGEAQMGLINPEFDLHCAELFAAGATAPLVSYLEREIPNAGNGAHEMRNWLVAHAAVGGKGFDLIDYFPCPEVYVGCAFAEWKL